MTLACPASPARCACRRSLLLPRAQRARPGAPAGADRVSRTGQLSERADAAQGRRRTRRQRDGGGVFHRRPSGLRDGAAALRMRVGRRSRRHGTPGAAGGDAAERGRDHSHAADQGAAIRRQGRRGCRAGDRHGQRRRRPLRGRASAVGVQGLRGRTAADDQPLHVRERAARADHGRRHQRQHDAGDAEVEAGREGVSRRRAGATPGQPARLQRRDLRADAERPPIPPSGCAPWTGSRPGGRRRCTT